VSLSPLPATALSGDDVAAFLRAHPHFLAERPELYLALAPPVRVHGEAMADHMAALLRAARAHADSMAARADSVLAAGRASAGLAARVQDAVLALIGAESVAECITSELPALLAIDAASLCVEADLPGARRLPAGMVADLLGSKGVLFRDGSAPDATLHGEAARLARHEALVRVPGDRPALIALVARDRHALEPAQGMGALGFLGRVVAARLAR
jgi:uncharacterized protein YigA (DUF484 family)